jgi:threonine dehydrogenase-like Zn-dependent dehydrogenase
LNEEQTLEDIMKAAVYEGTRKVKVEERLDIKAEPGDVILKIKYCGI